MRTALLSFLALSLAAASPAVADEIHDLLEKLQGEVKKTIAEHQKEPKSRYPMEQLSRSMEALTKDFQPGALNANDAARVLEQFAGMKASPEAKQIAAQLAALLPNAKAAAQKAFSEQVDAVLKKTAETCLAAKTDSDLDAISAEINALKKHPYDSSPEVGRNSARVEAAARFVILWQEYLSHLAKGYDEKAKDVLREMDARPSLYPILTHEQILSKIGVEPVAESPEKMLARVKNLDDLAAVIEQMSATNRRRRSTDVGAYETTAALNDLKQIYKAHTAAKAGLYHNAMPAATNIFDAGAGLAPAELIRIKTLLLAEILPPYLELPEAAKPRDGENPSQFLLRIADEAVAKGEWEKVQRVLEAYRVSAFGARAPSWLQGEITGCGAYLAAQRLENAGDLRRAVMEYEKTLLQPGKRLPLKEATTRLAALKKEHPEALEAAAKAGENGDDPSVRPRPLQQ